MGLQLLFPLNFRKRENDRKRKEKEGGKTLQPPLEKILVTAMPTITTVPLTLEYLYGRSKILLCLPITLSDFFPVSPFFPIAFECNAAFNSKTVGTIRGWKGKWRPLLVVVGILGYRMFLTLALSYERYPGYRFLHPTRRGRHERRARALGRM